MTEKFGKNYFYGRIDSNYINYEKMNASKYFNSVICFLKNQRLGKILDAGCAFGLLLRELRPFFDELYGFDISSYAIKRAKKIAPEANLKIADLNEELPYRDNIFDCITVFDVLEHTKKFEESFKRLTRKLKKGGYLIISVPIDNWFTNIIAFLDNDKTHFSILREKEIIQIVKRNNLKIISKKHSITVPIFYRIPYVPGSLELILRK
ncbi:hypothetical protein A3K64_01935 [Candidatus Micrarchaeota archaeon RBG_16_36_9]|nr:MAG: hypothetical protein A3K64_01935 [Candidatus Micrarchaeota archaeon RBG_16_36_9]